MKILTAALALAVATSTARSSIVTRPVTYENNGVALEGYLAYDDAKTKEGKLPGVLVIHEWWGLNAYAKHRAEQLAELGYVAFAADMYGKGKVTTDKTKAGEWAGELHGKPLMAERAQAGLDQLLGTGLVDPARVAAIGYCFGGTAVLELAYSGAPLAGIVSFHGGLVAASPEAAARNKAKFLICHGAMDPTMKREVVEGFLKSLDEGKVDYRFVQYAGAVHAFTNPDSDENAVKNGMQGMIGYSPSADRRSWEDMNAFFAEIFAPAKS